MRFKYERRQNTVIPMCAGGRVTGKRDLKKNVRKHPKVIKMILALHSDFTFFGRLLQLQFVLTLL